MAPPGNFSISDTDAIAASSMAGGGSSSSSMGPALTTSSCLMTFLSGCFLGLRIYCKMSKRRGLWWDDYMLIAAWVALLANTAVLIASIQLGLGMHMDDIHLENLATIGLLGTLGGSFSILAAVWSKTSFGLTLIRIAQKKTRIVVWVIIVTMNLAMVMIVVTSWIQCSPVPKVWNRLLPGSCWDGRVNVYYGLFAAAYSGAMDIVLALLPWTIVWKLQMRRKEKIGVGIAMSMGVFAGCTAFIKCSKIPTILNGDFTYNGYILIMWGSAEVAITIMAASIPVLRVLIRDVGMGTRRPYSGNEGDLVRDGTYHATSYGTGTVQQSNAAVAASGHHRISVSRAGSDLSFSTTDDEKAAVATVMARS
ncbi:hypothetical protein B0T19DRAFT_434879 [Cercophora scortea]|uniref:Rhodopsin domain-containing protein n=1 Tax=Cercophora scortea TaxID=314031 RepID=A0AAE0I2W6_9PEZI|nr:hypothetical protein B0T19DRAFT_434879 [Cercophora scortea]